MIEFVFAIYSCQKYLANANKMYNFYFGNQPLLAHLKMKVFIVYGDPTLETDYIVKNQYLILKSNDGYVDLCEKSLQLFKAVINMYPTIIGCFKCDDDIIINWNSIMQAMQYIKTNNVDYAGKSVMVKENKSNNLQMILKNIHIKQNIKTPSAIYCGGPLYYLSNKSMSVMKNIKNEDYIDIFYEDLMIGYILNKNKIFPTKPELLLYSDHIIEYSLLSYHNTNKKKNLFVRIHGGIGNQLFQVCSGLMLAKKHNMNFFIINSSALKQTFTHIDDNNYMLNTIFLHLNKINMELINLGCLQCFNEKEEDCFTYNSNIYFNDDVLLNGYFQNEKYFASAKNQLIPLLKNNKVYTDLLKVIDLDIISNSYFVHVRRGDYLNSNLYKFDCDKYYTMAINYILSITPNAHFVIVSDDINYCYQYNVFKNINKTYFNLPTLETLYLMSLCKKGGICANSTFSWWGSYLNDNAEKTVVFPSQWIQKPWNNDIYYENSVVIKI